MSGALGGLAQQAGANPYMNQGLAAQQHAAYMAQQRYTEPPRWVIDGKPMTITDFATELFGDTPQRTMFLLRYSDKGK
jgi:hypothetical protein